MKKPWLIDVPVALDAFCRPHTLKRVFEAVKQARPSILFLISDGPREHVPTDKANVAASRKIVENIDWDCEVHRLYFDTNQGMYKTGRDAREFIFKRVDRIIRLEDDILPSQSFFRFCAELLEKYKDDQRVSMICGMNHLGIYEEPSSDYFFSETGSIWGFAYWRRTMEEFDIEMKHARDKYILKLLKMKVSQRLQNYFLGRADKFLQGKLSDDAKFAFEFQQGVTMHLQNKVVIVPKKNMIHCLGATVGSAHASDDIRKMPKAMQRIFEMKTYEYDFPLKHPEFVIEDRNYEKKVNRIMGFGHPFVSFSRRCEYIGRQLIFSNPQEIKQKVRKKLAKRRE